MKGKKLARVALDVALTAMIVFEMLIQFTGEFLHEVVGFAFFVTIIMHVAFSAAWVKSTARTAKAGRLTARRTALAVMGILLAIVAVLLGVSSVAISGILESAGFVWPFGSYALWASVHSAMAYALCALVVVHLAMHWAFLASAFKVPYDPSRRRAISVGVNAVAALGVLAVGVAATGSTSLKTLAEAGASSTAGASGEVAGQGAATASGTVTAGAAVGSKTSGTDAGFVSVSDVSSSETSPNPAKSGQSAGKMSKDSSNSAGSSSIDESAADGGASDDTVAVAPTTSTATDICTLCRKQCPLSAPKCDKPYAAGLL